MRRDHLRCAFVLKRRVQSPRFTKAEFIPPRYHVYAFRMRSPSDLDREILGYLREAHAVGRQADRPPGPPR